MRLCKCSRPRPSVHFFQSQHGHYRRVFADEIVPFNRVLLEMLDRVCQAEEVLSEPTETVALVLAEAQTRNQQLQLERLCANTETFGPSSFGPSAMTNSLKSLGNQASVAAASAEETDESSVS